jgi:ribosomal protein L11 methyltransferase
VTFFLTLSFDLGSLDPQAAETACFELGARAVTLTDARNDPACHPVLEPLPGEVRLWPATRLSALFDGAEDAHELVHRVAARLALAPQLIHAAEVQDRVWEREWLKDFHPLRFGKRLWVCPRHEAVSEPGAVVVRLDPGLAFGTGAHPSTALCLEWLDAHLAAPVRVIDYGCGSGILALAAAKLGASAVHCFDIDPQALSATRDNARGNDVGHLVRVHEAAATLPPQADLLIANILSRPLCELAPVCAELVAREGRVVLAGLMRHEVPEVTGAYAAWFDVAGAGERDEWVCLAGQRR